jgi:ABC-type sugar transport system substrate-binding protein
MKATFRGFVFAAAALALSAQTPAQAQDLVFMSSMPTMQFPFFVHMQNAINAEADNIGGIRIVEADGRNQSPKQAADIENAIVQGVDGIIISPNDVNALASAIEEAVKAGIPVVTIDRRVDNVEGILSHVGADNVSGGESQGDYVVSRFPDGARIVNLQGQPGASPAIDRNKGLHNVIDPVSDKYEIVAEQTANWKRDEGLNVTNAILTGLSEMPDVIVAANDEMGLGALEALRSLNLEDKIEIVAFDAGPEALLAVKEGNLSGTVDQFPGEQSRQAVRILNAFVKDGKSPPQVVNLITPKMILAENIDDAERIGEVK